MSAFLHSPYYFPIIVTILKTEYEIKTHGEELQEENKWERTAEICRFMVDF